MRSFFIQLFADWMVFLVLDHLIRHVLLKDHSYIDLLLFLAACTGQHCILF